MREVVLTAASLALTGAVVANAYYQKHQFYPSVVYLTKSSPSMAVGTLIMQHCMEFFRFLRKRRRHGNSLCIVNISRCTGLVRPSVCLCYSVGEADTEGFFRAASGSRNRGMRCNLHFVCKLHNSNNGKHAFCEAAKSAALLRKPSFITHEAIRKELPSCG